MASTLTWYGVGLTDIGRVRASNQDALVIMNPLGLWGVADGMGGHVGGDVASQTAIGAVGDFFRSRASESSGPSHAETEPAHTEALLYEAIKISNQAIRREAQKNPKLFGMGTTIDVLRLVPGSQTLFSIAHVGDSRIYLLREETLTRLTRDHSAVEEYIRRGLMTPEQARDHPHRQILSRALGISERVEPDVFTHPLQPNDLLMLCTDGLNKMIRDDELQQFFLKAGPRPETICRRLVDETNERGGEDNVTVLVVKAVA